MSRRRASSLACLALVAALAAGCGDEREVVRVGVLVDCTGLIAASHDMSLAGAALPLLERGGHLARGGLENGAAGAVVGNRELELIPACTELTYTHLMIAATRRLIEEQHVDVVLGPVGTPEGVVFRDLAAHYPNVTFMSGAALAQQETLRDPQANLFRFTFDGPQSVAGLGAYAYDVLGWRRAVVVAEPYDEGWERVAGFVTEFCALGGKIVERDLTALLTPDPSAAARRHASADGVALIANFYSPSPYLGAYFRIAKPLGRRLVVAGNVFVDSNLAPKGIDLTGTIVAGPVPLDPAVPSMMAYEQSFARRFPALPPGTAHNPFVMPFYTEVEALATALEQTDGTLGEGQDRLRRALAGLVLDAPQGAVRLDRNRQATGHGYLERIVRSGSGGIIVKGVRTLDGVEQSFGDAFTATTPPPSAAQPVCLRRPPPSWAG